MPSRAGRSARGLGSGRRGDSGGRGGEGGHRRPPPRPLGSPRGPAPPPAPRGARRVSLQLPSGATACDPERSGGPAGGSEASGLRGAGGGQARGAPLWRTPGGRARCTVSRPGGCRRGRADGRGRRRPAGSWRERRAGRLPSVQTTAPTTAPLPRLHAQLAKRRVTAAGPLARGCPVELFLKGMASVSSLKDVSWRGSWGAPKAIKKLFETKQFLALQPSQLSTSSLILRRLSQPGTFWVEDET